MWPNRPTVPGTLGHFQYLQGVPFRLDVNDNVRLRTKPPSEWTGQFRVADGEPLRSMHSYQCHQLGRRAAHIRMLPRK